MAGRSGAAEAAPGSLPPETHTEILNSARRIVAQDGVEKFTLSAVAREAEVPRNALYGVFHNKNELLLAIAADDLTHMVRAMAGDTSMPAPDPLPHADLVLALADRADEATRARLPADTIFPTGEAVPPVVATEPPALQDGGLAAEMPFTARKHGEVSQLHDIIDRLTTLPTTPLGEGSAAALARMDRRMGVVEKVLADFEGRFDIFQKLANDGLEGTKTSLEGLVQRAERTDQRILETATTLRGELLAAFTRVVPPKTEPPKITLPPDESDIAVGDVTQADLFVSPAEAPTEIPAEPQGDLRTQLNRQTANDDYLSNARRSAAEAAVQAAPPPVIRRKKRKHFFKRNEMFGIGVISGAVILATMGIAASEGFIDVKHGHLGIPLAPATTSTGKPPQRVALAPQHTVAPAPKPVVAAAPPPQVATATSPPNLTPMERIEALANGGNTKAALLAGVKYLDGDGVARNEEDAAHWLERAAQSGEPVAQYRLGTLYQRGAGVVQDEAQAFRWYQAAANQGNRKAMHNLGVFYAEGRGTTQDYEKAASWFGRAADLGYVDSQFDLAVLYERGAGVPQSLGDAYKWYVIAAKNGDEPSRARVDVLETQLDPAELATARAAAHAFRATTLSRAANMTPQLADLSAH